MGILKYENCQRQSIIDLISSRKQMSKSERHQNSQPSLPKEKRRDSVLAHSQAAPPFFSSTEGGLSGSLSISQPQELRAHSSFSESEGANMVAGFGEPFYQQQWRRDYGSYPDTVSERRDYAYLSAASYDESTHCEWEELHHSEPPEPLLDNTFTRTIQLMASEDTDDDENIRYPEHQRAHPVFVQPRQQDLHCPAMIVHSPIRSQTSVFDEVTTGQTIAFAGDKKRRNSIQSSVEYGQLSNVVEALDDFTFVLPNLARCGRYRSRFDHRAYASEGDLNTARRRLISAVCYYGGNRRTASDAELARLHPIALRNRKTYEFLLSRRYRVHDDHISWSVEENPPAGRRLRPKNSTESMIATVRSSEKMDNINKNEEPALFDDEADKGASKEVSSTLSGQERKKAPYYCRLCGQPKQKHDCPFRRNLVRSIGTSVYPVLNSFQTDEIGELAPRLLDMNNFVGGRYCATSEADQKQLKITEEGSGTVIQDHNMGADKQALLQSKSLFAVGYEGGANDIENKLARMRMKSSSLSSQSELSTVQILPQQYKSVSLGKKSSPVAYRYPSVPVFKKQRTKISNDLFSITETIPYLTEECASVLEEAEEMNMWDQAAAELFAQVLTIIHCELGDSKLEGLSKHLRDRGIAC